MIGFDPEVSRYFKKIINSFSYGFLWLLAIAYSGIYYGLAIVRAGLHWYNIVFYICLALSLFVLLRYYYRLWK
jgi:hypothetical protein